MKETAKRLIVFLTVLAMIAALAACGAAASQSTASAPEASASEPETAAAEAGEPAGSEAAGQEQAEPAASAAEPEMSAEEIEMPEGPEPLAHSFFPRPETEDLSVWSVFPSSMSAYADSLEDYAFTKNVQEALNIDLVITSASDMEFMTLFPLMIASGDYTDVMMFNNYTDSYATAAEENIILDLTEYMDDYAPDYKALVEADRKYLAPLTSDEDHYYCIYQILDKGTSVSMGMLTRGDWMADAGFTEVPSTIAGYEEYLTALKDAGHSNALWMDSNGAYYNNVLSGAFGVSNGWGLTPYVVRDGKVVNSALEDGMKDYIETMARWYANDLIDKDFTSNTTVFMTDMSQVLSEEVGVWFEAGDRIASLEDQLDPGDGSLKMYALPFPVLNEGDSNPYVQVRDHYAGPWAVSTTCENVPLAVCFLNYGYTEEGQILCNWGVEGESFTVAADGSRQFTDEILNFPLGISRGIELYAASFMASHYDYGLDDMKNANCLEQVTIWSESAGDGSALLHLNNLSQSESDVVYGTSANDFNTYFKECSLKFMVGEMDIEKDWDSFVENARAMNTDEICEAYQAAYDRMQEKSNQ